MARYIDADKLEKEINSEKAMSFYDLLDKIHFAPSEDVRPVVRGKWEAVKGGYTVCNKCGAIGNSNYNGCPMCLADMREEKE
jgi:rubrerythrin